MSNPAVSPQPPRLVPPVVALIFDAVAIVVFSVVGAYVHHDDVTAGVFGGVVWPFLVGGVIGWLLAFGVAKATGDRLFRPDRIFFEGIVIWVSTVVAGIIIRWATDADADLVSWFVFITTLILLLLVIGWRVLAAAFYTVEQAEKHR